MAGDTVQEVKSRLSIQDVVSGYVKLERAGSSLRARCPFHSERTPSFHVSPERGTYHCFGCGVGGDIFSFVEQIEGVDFKGALKILAERAGVPLVYARSEKKEGVDRLFELMEVATLFYTSKLSDEAKGYLKERGLAEATTTSFRVGLAGSGWDECIQFLKSKKFSDKEILDAGIAKQGDRGLLDKFRNRIMFPISDSAGRVVGFSGRIFGTDASPDAPKYLNSPETPLFRKSHILYGFDKAKQHIRKLNCAVLVEGQMDLLASHQAGWGNTVAVSGTAFTPEHAALIKRMTENLVLALDADEAGIKAAGRAARVALQSGLHVKVARLPSGQDPAELIRSEGGTEAWKKAIKDAKDIIAFLLDVLEERMPERDRFRRAVETVVLPFVSDTASPIAREQYVREIAERLKVSESAVAETLRTVTSDTPRVSQEKPAEKLVGVSSRAEQALGLLLWLESQKKPDIVPSDFKKALSLAVGDVVMKELESLPKKRQETLLFSVERMYGASGVVRKEAEALLQVLHRDRLTKELQEATELLHRLEDKGSEEEIKGARERCKILTAQIARLHSGV